MTVDTRG